MINVPDFFKYNSLISVPLFSIIALLLIRKTKDFSFYKHTVSKSINFLHHPFYAIIFRLNFIIKALLDLGFAFYVINHFQISLKSPISWALIISALLFGSLAYFIEGKHTTSHRIITYISGVLWAVDQIFIVRLINNTAFLIFTIIIIPIPLILAFLFLFTKKTNVILQGICMLIWQIWLILFVFQYL